MALYFAVFVFSTVFEYKKEIYYKPKRKFSPRVSLVVPCYNEEKTLGKTLQSFFDLDYPRNNLEIIVIDDGSVDGTLKVAREFAQKDSRIKVFHKENGGKYTALNLGIIKSTCPYLGTVDADSFLHKDSLKKIMEQFEDSKVMAVISSVRVANPKNILEGVQYVEYLMGNFLKKVFSFLNGINVVPGPLSVFNKKVFTKIGPYKKAHQTEDLEMAFRMQKNNLVITQAVDAIVYTQGCKTFKELLKQRLRWNKGGLLNYKDYPELLDIRKHGNLAYLLLNSVVGCFITIALFIYTIYRTLDFSYSKLNQLLLAKADFFRFSFALPDWIKFDITPLLFLGLITLGAFLVYIFLSKKFTKDPGPSKRNVVLFIIIFPFLNGIFWLITLLSILFKRKDLVWD
ncbi:MAG: glycosyltransferase [Candidatus Pacebacteria bacterium]|nr:glycosyltransferase [Candidatus Paceibacterota bacterium]